MRRTAEMPRVPPVALSLAGPTFAELRAGQLGYTFEPVGNGFRLVDPRGESCGVFVDKQMAARTAAAIGR